jgi:glutamyl-tRNA reductase
MLSIPQLVTVGTNHKFAPIELREKLNLGTNEIRECLNILTGDRIDEAVILSTCNRTEIYAVTYAHQNVSKYLTDMMSKWSDIPYDQLIKHCYVLFNDEAIGHLFAVASGLDSLVIGEQQIQTQVRNAARVAFQSGTIGQFLRELFQSAYRAASRIRKENELGLEGASVSSAAVALLKSCLPRPHSILIIGAGKMMTLAADNLASMNGCEILVTNRTGQRAEAMAQRLGGKAWPIEELYSALGKVDAVLAFTSSSDYIVHAKDFKQVMLKRGNRAIILIDGSVPRNIDPQTKEIPGVQLYNIDDLVPIVEARSTDKDISSVKEAINAEVERFYARLRSYQVNDTLKELRRKAEEIRAHELSRALNRMDNISIHEKEMVDLLTRRIVNKLLYAPTTRLKEHASNGDGKAFDALVRELFAIGPDSE